MENSELLQRAKEYCLEGKHRFTQPRERVLSLLANAEEPMGAYQILDALSSDQEKINPPTIYRAIEFWARHGFIHKVQSMNAYMVCCQRHHHENFCIFVCDDCHTVIEFKMRGLPSSITKDIENQDLTIAQSNVEIHGSCSQCA